MSTSQQLQNFIVEALMILALVSFILFFIQIWMDETEHQKRLKEAENSRQRLNQLRRSLRR